MRAIKINELYEEHIKSLSVTDRLRLIALISHELANPSSETSKHTIMDLHGLGKNIWKDIDAQQYIDNLRDEWKPL